MRELILSAHVDANRWAVRNGDQPVKVGDKFGREVYYQPRGLEDLEKPPVAAGSRRVDVRVADIHAYGRFLDEMGEGMTAVVTFEGPDSDSLTTTAVLQ